MSVFQKRLLFVCIICIVIIEGNRRHVVVVVVVVIVVIVMMRVLDVSIFQVERPLFVFGGNPKKTSELESPILRA